MVFSKATSNKIKKILKEGKQPAYYLYSDEIHLSKALDWLTNAQDKVPESKGIAKGFHIFKGWLPTKEVLEGDTASVFLCTSRPEYKERAYKLIDHLLTQQVPFGWFLPSKKGKQREPSVFVTGKILDALLNAYFQSKNKKYLNAAKKAGDWLLLVQASDGTWRRYTPYSRPQAYHVNIALTLTKLGDVLNNDKYKEAALRFCNWLSSMYEPRLPWLWHLRRSNDLAASSKDIGITLCGMTKIAQKLQIPNLLARATDLAEKILMVYRKEGLLYPKYTPDWTIPEKGYIDLTGCAWMAKAFLSLDQASQGVAFGGIARSIIQYIKSTHTIKNFLRIKGGVKASQPIKKGDRPLQISTETTSIFALVLMDAKDKLLPKWWGYKI